MSNEIKDNSSSFGSLLALPAVQGGMSAGIALKTHGKNVFKAQNNAGFKELNKQLKDAGVDYFTRSQALAVGYDNYKTVAKNYAKTAKKLNKATKKGKIGLFERFKNLFRKDAKKVTIEGLENLKTSQKTMLDSWNKAVENGGEFTNAAKKVGIEAADIADDLIIKATKEAGEQGFKATLKGAGKYVKTNFKNELGFKNGWFNYLMTAIQFGPKITEKIIPAFKEEGFGAGMKEIGKTLVQAGTDLVAYATGGAIGRVVGAGIGTVIAPGVGTKVGAFLGDMICSLFVGSKVCSAVDKVIGAEEKPADENQNQQTFSQVNAQNLSTVKQAHQLSLEA